MNTTMLLDRCTAAGITLSAASGVLHVDAPATPEADTLLRELRANRKRVLSALQPVVQPPTPDLLRRGDPLVVLLRSFASKGEYALTEVPALLRCLLADGLWRDRVIEQTGERAAFSRFEDFITAPPLEGLGTTPELLRRLCDPERDADVLAALNGEPQTLTPSQYPQNPQNRGRSTDPRPELPHDSAYWTVLLRHAQWEDNEAALGALHGVRCCGARISLQPSGVLRIEAGEGYLGNWAADRERWLAPHRADLIRWLRLLLEGDADVAQRALHKTVWPVDLHVEDRPVETPGGQRARRGTTAASSTASSVMTAAIPNISSTAAASPSSRSANRTITSMSAAHHSAAAAVCAGYRDSGSRPAALSAATTMRTAPSSTSSTSRTSHTSTSIGMPPLPHPQHTPAPGGAVPRREAEGPVHRSGGPVAQPDAEHDGRQEAAVQEHCLRQAPHGRQGDGEPERGHAGEHPSGDEDQRRHERPGAPPRGQREADHRTEQQQHGEHAAILAPARAGGAG